MLTGREEYIATTTYLIGSEDAKNFVLEAGTYSYEFDCPIPVNCPSSFEGVMGHIRYLARVSFMRSGASNRTRNVGFTVLKALDLNQENALLKAPINNETRENFCLFYDKAVHVRMNLAQGAYVPGQMILTQISVNNQSSFDCKKVYVFLNLRAHYTSDTPCTRTQTERICLVKKFCGSVPKHTLKDFTESIRVPPTPPTCEHLSKVVRISYEICAVAVMNSLMNNPKVEIPITIGSVPLVNYASATLDMATTSTGIDTPLQEFDAQSFDENDDDDHDNELELDMPPPTYEEAMFMTTDIADDDVNTVSETAQFTPRYLVYNDEIGPDGAPIQPARRRRRRKQPAPRLEVEQEKAPRESPVQI